MKKRMNGHAPTFIAVACMTLPGVVRPVCADPKPKSFAILQPGEFKITPYDLPDELKNNDHGGKLAFIEANLTPTLTLLQAIAEKLNHKLIVSDGAKEKLKGHRYSIYNSGGEV